MATPKSATELNNRLIAAIIKILRLGYHPTSGNSYDSMVLELLKRELEVKVINASVWKSDDWAEPRLKVSKRIFCFDSEFDQAVIVDKPNGSQKWPDCLLVYKKVGLPIEFKRSGNGAITWNSGLPRLNGIYIYNGQSRNKDGTTADGTTAFLGQAMLAPAELLILTQASGANSDTAKRFNVLLADKKSEWTLYARPMFTCGNKPLISPERHAREQAVLGFVQSLDWVECKYTKIETGLDEPVEGEPVDSE
jgi:hypothetical protein